MGFWQSMAKQDHDKGSELVGLTVCRADKTHPPSPAVLASLWYQAGDLLWWQLQGLHPPQLSGSSRRRVPVSTSAGGFWSLSEYPKTYKWQLLFPLQYKIQRTKGISIYINIFQKIFHLFTCRWGMHVTQAMWDQKTTVGIGPLLLPHSSRGLNLGLWPWRKYLYQPLSHLAGCVVTAI